VSSIDSLIERFSRKVEFAVQRAEHCSDKAYFDGLQSYVLGGAEIQDIIDYAAQSREHKAEIGGEVRERCSRLFQESGIINHALEKPHGYAGDYEMLEYIYDMRPHDKTQSEIGKTIDIWALNLSLPRAVRSRKNAIYFWLYEFAEKSNKRLKIMSVGCGSARELRELPNELLAKMDVTLIDKDANTLEFAKRSLLAKNPKLNVKAINADFHKVELKGSYDLVYCFGVFDYLTDGAIKPCLKRISGCLDLGSSFIYSIKNSTQYQDWFYDIFTNWRFRHRTIEDGADLLQYTETVDGQLVVKDFGLEMTDICSLESNVAAVYVCKKFK